MDKPPTERITITVKGLDPEAWETAKKAANKRGETQGEWLTRACLHLANLEQNDGVITAKPSAIGQPVTQETLGAAAALAELLAGMGAAGAAPTKTVVSRANRVAATLAGAALPPTAPRGAAKKATTLDAAPAIAAAPAPLALEAPKGRAKAKA